jgi:hypothetical protein
MVVAPVCRSSPLDGLELGQRLEDFEGVLDVIEGGGDMNALD